MPSLALELALLSGLVVLTALVMPLATGAAPVFEVHPTVRTLLYGLALGGPWLLYFEGALETVGPVTGPVVPLALAWGSYALAVRAVGTDGDGCSRSRTAKA